MRLCSLLIVPALLLAAACGGSDQAPAASPSSPPAPSAAPPDAPASAAPAASATPAASAAPSAEPAASAAPPPPPSVPAAAKPWDQLKKPERMEVMKTAVLPNMKTAFQGYDAKDYAEFNCASCHGSRIKQGNFKMPNPDLPKLDFKHDLKDDLAQHPATVKFMEETVVPEMVTMLGVPHYDMKTKKGFGCEACHTGK